MSQPLNFVISGSYGEHINGVLTHLGVKFRQYDSGRGESKRSRQKNDCTVRAYAAAFDLPYDEVYDSFAVLGRKCGRGFNFRDFAKTHPRLRWHSFPAEKGKSRMNPAKFGAAYPTGRWIARTAKHVFAIIDGVVIDTHSPSPARCIYGAWEVLAGGSTQSTG